MNTDSMPVKARRRLTPLAASAAVLALAALSWGGTRAWTDGDAGAAATNAPQAVKAVNEQVVSAMSKALVTEFPEANDGSLRSEILGPDGISAAASASEAVSAYVLAGDGQSRQWRLYVTTPKGARDAKPECPSFAETADNRCDSKNTPMGVETTTTFISVKLPEAGPEAYAAAASSDVTGDNLKNLRVERITRLYLPAGGYVSAREVVYGPTTLDFDKVFSDPQKLVDVVQSPELLNAIAAAD